ncbi:hypothetical protein [Metabacillus litoralis]|uniref:hypothetical protein n=1 Tax=Metabacillus litoralis TaxID=152268 RepID=UPI00203EE66F|nr:hypothetical protein [Metabacillus litoralis]MCM3411448.1 hypothetical protein [Metabacillus litoralis]
MSDRYNIMHVYWNGPNKMIRVMDWKEGKMVGFTFDEIDKENLDLELREYIRSIKDDIENGKYNYKI